MNRMYRKVLETSLGAFTLASDGEQLTGLWLRGQKYEKQTIHPTAVEDNDLPLFLKVEEWLERYAQGEAPSIDFLLKPEGSTFRQEVWKHLLAIPYGEVETYGNIAKKMERSHGRAMSAQAVGGAVGHNPISILIPCHRVVGSNGSLTGYAGGIDMKKHLLTIEGVQMNGLYEPRPVR
ncbi:Methylated-DNA--protein-cysteine methyltransferase [Shouchella lehensis G1]|uniref:Methylated-DNA--protein-cysteine methyltransferase n=2 Tax=Shouchella lehensis TaxID=300825 RepID=A0A060M655_9BACI|nr:Methylated-DNA--protein-cysteine methyltransferase [Shouchella lehensis G1]